MLNSNDFNFADWFTSALSEESELIDLTSDTESDQQSSDEDITAHTKASNGPAKCPTATRQYKSEPITTKNENETTKYKDGQAEAKANQRTTLKTSAQGKYQQMYVLIYSLI